MRRGLGDGYELDDDRNRIDLDAVHGYLSGESYWAKGRPRATQERLIRESTRVVGLYKDGEQIGFCRAFTDGVAIAYLADVYVLAAHRGRGLGEELVREMIENGPLAGSSWILHTKDLHPLYRKFGFDVPGERLMERPAGYADKRSTSQASESG
jgi:predicted N-acetyltransferase YhbS